MNADLLVKVFARASGVFMAGVSGIVLYKNWTGGRYLPIGIEGLAILAFVLGTMAIFKKADW